MAKMNTLKTVDLTYFDTAPVSDQLTQTIPASAEETFRCLEDGDAWSQWVGGITAVEWTSPKPWGVGTTRTVTLKPNAAVEEEFIAWEDGRRMAFYFVRAGVPVFGAFIEDYVLTPKGDDACELTWKWAFEGGGLAKYMHPLMAFGFKRQGKGALAKLAEYMQANRSKYQG